MGMREGRSDVKTVIDFSEENPPVQGTESDLVRVKGGEPKEISTKDPRGG